MLPIVRMCDVGGSFPVLGLLVEAVVRDAIAEVAKFEVTPMTPCDAVFDTGLAELCVGWTLFFVVELTGTVALAVAADDEAPSRAVESIVVG